ncbi:MAG TPA: M3 family oligoendopeptidase [Rhizomicrobium sp.]|nr:M3 family oligoendopeptidase [Rhizomicrobium sp.]
MKRLLAAFAVAAFTTTAFAADAPQATLPDWDIADLYASPQAWTDAYTKTKAQAEALSQYKGTLGKSAAAMLAAFDALSKVNKETQRLVSYAGLVGDEDVRVSENQERVQLAADLQTRIGENTAWMTPEIITIGEKKVAAFEAQSPELKTRFGFALHDALRSAPHTLSQEGERIMAASGNMAAQPGNIYSQLANGDLPFPSITLSDGMVIKRLDLQSYSKYRQVANRADRKKVFDNYFATYKKFEGTFGQVQTAQVLSEEFNAKQRQFPTALDAALFSANMPEGVYHQLVAQANAGLPVFHRYLALRKKMLGIKDELAYYDIYPSMFAADNPPKYTVDDAHRIALAVTSAYGPDYTAMLDKALSSKWIDTYPREGKAGDQYETDAYDVHPYMHLNYNDDFESLSVYVHEWGHAVHSMLANKAQPYETANYSTFIAETASISNQMLLSDYMVAHAKTNAEKLFFLDKELELIRSTFFRQTMFAEFQLAIHEEVEQGKPLSGARMTELYCSVLKKYHGADRGVMTIDPAYCSEWSIIPHFYFGFYVWQYATSMAGAAQFTDAIEKEGAPARDRYIAMLKAGGSDYPYELYKKAGIDMASPAPYQALIARMNSVIDQIDALTAK